MSRSGLRGIGKAVAAFAATALALAGVLLGTTLIPRSAIERHALESAEYLCQKDLFFEVVDGIGASKVDRYADAILLGIAWQYDSQDPLRSVMASAFYHHPQGYENIALRQAVSNDLPANQEYLRYWHGSIALVRPLLTILPIQGIYRLLGLVLLVLVTTLLVRLWRRGALVPLVGMLVSVAGTSWWFVPFSLEYTWVPLVLLVQLHLVLGRRFPQHHEGRALFFLVSGIVTNYLDFLTAELLTLLVPLALIVWLDHDEHKAPPAVWGVAKLALAWLVGYAGMWALKWLLAHLVLGTDFEQAVAFHVWNRSGSLVVQAASQQKVEALARNLGCLFPWGYGEAGRAASGVLAAATTCYVFVRRRSTIDIRMIACYLTIATIPFVRFLALNNHAYLHYFFTHRVLAATLFATVLILGELTHKEVPDARADSNL